MAVRATVRLPSGVTIVIEADTPEEAAVMVGLVNAGIDEQSPKEATPVRWSRRKIAVPPLDVLAGQYRRAHEQGQAPRAVIAEKYGVSQRTVTNWLALAREAGELEPWPSTTSAAEIKDATIKEDQK